MRLRYLEADEWAVLSELAHRAVFDEKKPAALERIDYALITEAADETPMSYVTCRELDGESVYWQYGGSFPNTKGTVHSLRSFELFLAHAKSNYRRVTYLVENTNFAMLKLAMRCGFVITGVRVFKGTILLEHLLEF